MGKEERLRRVVPWSQEVGDRARQAHWPPILIVRDARFSLFRFFCVFRLFRVFVRFASFPGFPLRSGRIKSLALVCFL